MITKQYSLNGAAGTEFGSIRLTLINITLIQKWTGLDLARQYGSANILKPEFLTHFNGRVFDSGYPKPEDGNQMS